MSGYEYQKEMTAAASSIAADWPGESAREKSRVEEALYVLDAAISKHEDLATTLLRRLDIVLQPEVTSDANPEFLDKPSAPKSTLVHRIEGLAEDVRRLTGRLGRALDRLDI